MMNYVEDCELFSIDFRGAMFWHTVGTKGFYYIEGEYEDYENMLLMGGEMG